MRSAMVRGVSPVGVDVEVGVSRGIPGVSIVGMPDASVLEARSRVRCAMRACGFSVPRLSVMVNLAPGDVRKGGTAFDLPIAVAILAATGQLPAEGLGGCLVVGELALDGSVCPVRGAVAYAEFARRRGLVLVGPASEGVEGVDFRPVSSLADLREGVLALPPARPAPPAAPPGAGGACAPDFGDVCDQEAAKRACVIAAAGGHGLLMVGPPGAGKTMIARCLPSILPPLEGELRREALMAHSVVGEDVSAIAAGRRPFRMPHHSVSAAGLVGGDRPVRPGEATLAHGGVLFLDELPEFSRSALQALRQPMEEGEVRLVRADGVYRMPSRFMLVAAANPCPCGNLGDPRRRCVCSEAAVERYRSKLTGPLVDRIDLQVEVARPDPARLIGRSGDTGSAEMAARVAEGRAFASWRRSRGIGASGEGPVASLGFERAALSLLEGVARNSAFGGRATVRVAQVARTVADLAGHELVGADDVAEACFFRVGAR